EPRPQSGYYVRRRLPDVPAEPKIDLEELVPTEATTGEIAAQIHLDIGNPDIVQLGAAVPAPEALPSVALARHLARQAQLHPTESVGYRVPPGELLLREQIAKHLVECGCLISPDEVLITFGCQEAVMMALLALCSPGDTVAIESPAYFSFIQQLERLKLRGIEVPTTQAEGMSLEALEYALEHERVKACLLTANYSNPIGSLMPDEHKRRLVQLLRSHDVPLIEDDIYGDLFFGTERARAVKAYDEEGNVLLCSSFSKTLCPGYRVGWIVPGRYRRQVEQTKMTLSIATSTPAQMAVASYLASGAYVRHLRLARRMYASNLESVADAVGRYFPEGTRVTQPRGGIVLWVELPAPFDSVRLYETARHRGISIAPGPIFSLTGKFRNALRLNAASWSPRVEEAIKVLGDLAAKQVARPEMELSLRA
ncbi:MAG TPA: PLP-dependent aminotransferase family protein, partial [Spirochaetia bacterium]|nr:PLP-dependent aminotransferase family protein [Spirochaetia bacterium]